MPSRAAEIVTTVAAGRDLRFRTFATSDAVLRGWFVSRSLFPRRKAPDRDPDLEAITFHEFPLYSSHIVGTVVFLNAIYLPDHVQGQGMGGELVGKLQPVWADAGVAEVRAVAGTTAGAVALPAWGFIRSGEEIGGLEQWFLPLLDSGWG